MFASNSCDKALRELLNLPKSDDIQDLVPTNTLKAKEYLLTASLSGAFQFLTSYFSPFSPCIAALHVWVARIVRVMCMFACALLLTLDRLVYACFMY